jgi:hypothetical protein
LLGSKDIDDEIAGKLYSGEFYGSFINNNGVLTPGYSANRDGLTSLGAIVENTIKKGIQKKKPGTTVEAGKDYLFQWTETPGRQGFEINFRKMDREGRPTGDGDVYTLVPDADGHAAILLETYAKGKVSHSILKQDAFDSFEFRAAEELPNDSGWDLSASVKAGIAYTEAIEKATREGKAAADAAESRASSSTAAISQAEGSAISAQQIETELNSIRLTADSQGDYIRRAKALFAKGATKERILATAPEKAWKNALAKEMGWSK